MTPRPGQHGGGVELIPVLHSIRTVSARQSVQTSPLRGEIRRRSALSAASTAQSAIDDDGEKNEYAAIAPAKESERPLEGEIIPPPRRKRRGRPSKRAQKLVREQLRHGPKPGSTVMVAAHLADISERSLIAATDALGVRTQRGQWWLPG
jgi:hypothetical protein